MNKTEFKIIVAYFITIFLSTQGHPNELTSYFNDVNDQMFHYYDELNTLSFNKNPKDLAQDNNALRLVIKIANLTLEARKFLSYFTHWRLDKEDYTALNNILNSGFGLILSTDYFNSMHKNVQDMRDLGTDRVLCAYQNQGNCRKGYKQDIIDIIKNKNDDSIMLKYYWLEYRKKTKTKAMTALQSYIENIRIAAGLARSSKSVLPFWYQAYNSDENVLRDMEQIIMDLEPFYRQIHTVIRHGWNRKFGDVTMPKNGPIPHHLFETILVNSKTKVSNYLAWYPSSKHVLFEKPMDYYGVSKHKVFADADEFFANMGFSKLINDDLYAIKKIVTFSDGRSEIRERVKSDGQFFGPVRGIEFRRKSNQSCEANVFDKTPNIIMEYCDKNSFEDMMYVYRDWAKVQYAVEKHYYKGLPFPFWNSYNFEDALGEAAILSASSSKYLRTSIDDENLMPDFIYKDMHQMNRLWQLAVQTMLNLHVQFVHAKLIHDLLLGGPESTLYLNRQYWYLMEKYVGVQPPLDRKKEDLDLPNSFYEDVIENKVTKKFFTEVLGYQFYYKLCEIRGEYNSSYETRSLHRCSFTSKGEYFSKTGEVLKQLMETGSKSHWKETLSILTGNLNGLQADAILKYFQPLIIWLEDEINRNNLILSWEEATRHVI